MRFSRWIDRLIAAGLVTSAVIVAGEAQPPADHDTLVIVNGVAISRAELDANVAAAIGEGQPDSPALRQTWADELVSRELLVQEAQRRKLDERPEVRAELEKVRRFVLVQTMLEDYARAHPITETALHDAYNHEKATLAKRHDSSEYRLRQILVPTEGSARDAMRRLAAGESFERLAAELSMDPLSRDKGGDLGWVLPTQLVSPLDAAVRALGGKGVAAKPVVSPLGWHVIEIEDTRAFRMPSFEESRGRIAQELALQQRQALVAELRERARIQ